MSGIDCPKCRTELETDSKWPDKGWCYVCEIWYECEADYVGYDSIAAWCTGTPLDPQPPPPSPKEI